MENFHYNYIQCILEHSCSINVIMCTVCLFYTFLLVQTEVRVDFSRKMPSNKMSINSSVTGLTLSTAKYPDLDKSISKPVSELHVHVSL